MLSLSKNNIIRKRSYKAEHMMLKPSSALLRHQLFHSLEIPPSPCHLLLQIVIRIPLPQW